MGNIRILLLVVIFGVFLINFYPETENSSLLVFGISASDNNNIINTSAQPGANQTNSPLDLLVQDFAVIMIVATVMLLISFKLKQSAVIGYIIAGMVIGPYTPPFSLIHNLDTLNAFAELGIIMLLFVIGIDFPINRLRQVGRISAIVAVAESMGTLLITFVVAQFLGLSYFDSLFIALALSITSTAVTLKVT
ncbi:cation:proton antiporter [Candidatus Nitrosocosmicus sp. FF01]|uniref:cation:proton antiporter domain-containing protein n=1 Tax=Candidatus Nitrosocosmicus sp. FF01 TaxID=3397670 RepID=UPI0039E9A857